MERKPFEIGRVGMDLPIMVGAGACKTPSSVLSYMRMGVSVGAVSTGSYTPLSRTGNEGVLFWPDNVSDIRQGGIGLNAFGMPNMGNEQAAADLKRYSFMYPVIASIAGFSVDDYVAGVRAFDQVPCVAAIKVNVGCPNAHDHKTVPIAYDPDSLGQILKAFSQMKISKPLWLKLSPYITSVQRDELQDTYPHVDFSHVPTVAPEFLSKILGIVWRYQVIDAIVFSNTLPNVIIRSADNMPVTTPNSGKAGLSGRLLKPISINLIKETWEILSGEVDLVGSGGVWDGDDVMDYIEAGAVGVFATSGPFWSGNDPRFFADLISGSERLQAYLLQRIKIFEEKE